MSDLPSSPEEDLDLAEIEEAEETDVAETELDGAEGDGDEPEDDAEEGDDVDPAPRRGGGAATPRNLRRRAQDAERERDQVRGELAELRRSQNEIQQRLANDPNARARAEAAEADALSRMTSDEQSRYFYQKGRQEVGQALQQIEARNADQLDRLGFESAARASPLHQRYKTQVEAVLASERSQGRSPPREVILDYLIGKDVRERAGRAAPGQRRQAARRVQGQQARPGAARGDAAGGRRAPSDSIEAARERVKGRALW